MTDWNALTIACMVTRYPAGPWDVLPGCDAPPAMPICMRYPSLVNAVDCLLLAGFRPAGHSIPAPGLDGPYDLTSCLRYSAGSGQDIVLVRWLGPESAPLTT